jgi:hypothetical protein
MYWGADPHYKTKTGLSALWLQVFVTVELLARSSPMKRARNGSELKEKDNKSKL